MQKFKLKANKSNTFEIIFVTLFFKFFVLKTIKKNKQLIFY
jgi:hypothetical protein